MKKLRPILRRSLSLFLCATENGSLVKEWSVMYILAAVFLDALFGDPKRLPHPVAGVGAVVRFWEKRLYEKDDKRRAGVIFCVAVLITTATVVGLVLLLASLTRPLCGVILYGAVVLYLLYASLASKY